MLKLPRKIIQYKGAVFADARGNLKAVNGFNFKGVKRFYEVNNLNTQIIRAFHGHLKEAKYIYVASGSVILCLVPLKNIKEPSKQVKVHRKILSARRPQVVYIPPCFANGFRSLEKNTKIVFFSTSTLKESLKDDYRYPFDYWGKAIWKIKNR